MQESSVDLSYILLYIYISYTTTFDLDTVTIAIEGEEKGDRHRLGK